MRWGGLLPAAQPSSLWAADTELTAPSLFSPALRLQTLGGACRLAAAPRGSLSSLGATPRLSSRRDHSCRSPPTYPTPALRRAHSFVLLTERAPTTPVRAARRPASQSRPRVDRGAPWCLSPKPRRSSFQEEGGATSIPSPSRHSMPCPAPTSTSRPHRRAPPRLPSPCPAPHRQVLSSALCPAHHSHATPLIGPHHVPPQSRPL